jgi:hypothetical protein
MIFSHATAGPPWRTTITPAEKNIRAEHARSLIQGRGGAIEDSLIGNTGHSASAARDDIGGEDIVKVLPALLVTSG